MNVKKSIGMRLLVGIVLIAAALIGFKFLPLATQLKLENLRLWKEQAGILAPLGYIAIYAIAIIFAVPATIFIAASISLAFRSGSFVWAISRN